MSERYAVIFEGEILEGQDEAAVQQRVGALFKADAAKITALFSGKRVTIKKGIDEATANKFVAAFAKAGAKAHARSMDAPADPPPQAAPEPPKAEPAQQTAESAAASAPTSADSGGSDAAAGEAPQTVVDIQPGEDPDKLSMADVGEVLAEDRGEDAPPPPEALEAELADAGVPLPAPPKDDTPPPEPGDWQLSEEENQGQKASFSLDP
ncbi:MAG: hypothetical protein ACQES2_11765 [Pseudomonadota bacterium]